MVHKYKIYKYQNEFRLKKLGKLILTRCCKINIIQEKIMQIFSPLKQGALGAFVLQRLGVQFKLLNKAQL